MLNLFHPTFILTAIIASILSYFVVYVIENLDINKRVYNHVPGECSNIPPIIHGASDMISFDKFIFIATGNNINNSTNTSNAAILTYKSDTRELNKPDISSFSDKKRLNPHGISIYMNILFVANNLYPEHATDRVDIFSIYLNKIDDTSSVKLRFQKSVTSEVMTGIRGIVAIGKEHFYLANRHYFRKPFYKNMEVIMKMNTGAILYFDGKKINVAVDNIPTPTGLDYDRRKMQLYVSCYSINKIYIYNAKYGNITKVNEIELPSAPYFVRFDMFTSSLLITAHPLKLKYLLYEHYPNEYYSPSQVIEVKRIKDKKGKQKWSIFQLYVNDGATITAATSVMMTYPMDKPRQLLIGNMHSSVLVCDVTS